MSSKKFSFHNFSLKVMAVEVEAVCHLGILQDNSLVVLPNQQHKVHHIVVFIDLSQQHMPSLTEEHRVEVKKNFFAYASK